MFKKYLCSEGKVAIHYCQVFLCLIDMFNLYVLLKIMFQSVNKSFLQNREREKKFCRKEEKTQISLFSIFVKQKDIEVAFCQIRAHFNSTKTALRSSSNETFVRPTLCKNRLVAPQKFLSKRAKLKFLHFQFFWNKKSLKLHFVKFELISTRLKWRHVHRSMKHLSDRHYVKIDLLPNAKHRNNI
jgi:hypothetical protein